MIYRLLLSLTILLFPLSSGPANAQEAVITEYQVKAAFLYNFLKFVEWPEAAHSDNGPRLSVCVLGEDPFGPALDGIRGNAVGNKAVEVKRINDLRGIKDCASVFICKSENRKLAEILKSIRNSAVLTISDIGGFAEAGGMIGFITEENKVRFKININAVERGRLSISSKLLRVGYIVGDSND